MHVPTNTELSVKVLLIVCVEVLYCCAWLACTTSLCASQIVFLIILAAVPLTQALSTTGSGSTAGLIVHTCSFETGFVPWFVLNLSFVAVLLIYGLFVAILTRNLPTAFNESVHIMVQQLTPEPPVQICFLSILQGCLFVVATALLILVPLDFLSNDNPDATALLRVSCRARA